MWPFSPRIGDIIGIDITDTHVRFSRIQRTGALYKLIDYYEQPLNRHEIIDGIPYKVSQIVTYVTNFIASHKIRRPVLTFALDDAWLNPRIETSIRTSTENSNIVAQHQLNAITWYTVEIARERLFYYQLISLQLSLPCVVITTANDAALTALNMLMPKKLYESKYDIDYSNYIQTMCTIEHLQRIDRTNWTISEHALATALGLYIQGSEHL